MKHLKIKVRGRVQGVFFRDSVLKKAIDLGLGGFVRNEPDSSVYIEIEGESESLQEFVHWCQDGPPMARVEGLDIDESSELEGFKDFRID